MKLEQINESFNRPYNLAINWKYKPNKGVGVGARADFETDNGEHYRVFGIKIAATKEERDSASNILFGGIWEIHFVRSDKDKDTDEDYWSHEVSQTGDSFQVMSTIFDYTKKLIHRVKPEYISIKVKGDGDGRSSLYQRMANRYASKFGYHVSKVIKSGDTTRINIKAD